MRWEEVSPVPGVQRGCGVEPSVTGHGGGSQPGAGVKVEPGSTYFKVGRMRNLVNAAYLEEYGRLSVRLSCKKCAILLNRLGSGGGGKEARACNSIPAGLLLEILHAQLF